MSPEKKRKQPKIAWRELGKEQPGAGVGVPGSDVPPAPAAADASPAFAEPAAVAAPVAAPVEPLVEAPARPASPLAIAAALNAASEAHAVRLPVTPAEPDPRDPESVLSPEAEVHRILARLATFQPAPRAVATVVEEEEVADVRVMRRGPSLPDEEELAPAVTPAMMRDAARARKGRAELLLFRAGLELFALPLGAVEEAIESPGIASLPEMPSAMLGVFRLRERLVPTYSPAGALGVTLRSPVGAALLARSGERRIALAVDDVEDVMELDLATLRDPPVVDEIDGILLGVARFGRELVAVLDPEALISACIGGRTLETT